MLYLHTIPPLKRFIRIFLRERASCTHIHPSAHHLARIILHPLWKGAHGIARPFSNRATHSDAIVCRFTEIGMHKELKANFAAFKAQHGVFIKATAAVETAEHTHDDAATRIGKLDAACDTKTQPRSPIATKLAALPRCSPSRTYDVNPSKRPK